MASLDDPRTRSHQIDLAKFLDGRSASLAQSSSLVTSQTIVATGPTQGLDLCFHPAQALGADVSKNHFATLTDPIFGQLFADALRRSQ